MPSRSTAIALILWLATVASAAQAQQIGGPAVGLRATSALVLGDTGRPKAIEYSDGYAVRLKIHLIASYFELPLFVGEYFLGEKLLTDQRNGLPTSGGAKSAHSAVATGLGALFTVNTVTGVWNLFESRHDPAGRTRRWLHSLAMIAADAGFVLTANAAGDARRTDAGANTHRNLAIGSMSLAAASTIMMWLWKD